MLSDAVCSLWLSQYRGCHIQAFAILLPDRLATYPAPMPANVPTERLRRGIEDTIPRAARIGGELQFWLLSARRRTCQPRRGRTLVRRASSIAPIRDSTLDP